ncbi:MAG: hypothetical protein U1F76_29725 [Candidatus Competibacteraceae bacterium]
METSSFQELVENSADLIQIISPGGRLLYVNRVVYDYCCPWI